MELGNGKSVTKEKLHHKITTPTATEKDTEKGFLSYMSFLTSYAS
jgi:hypothetical protein